MSSLWTFIAGWILRVIKCHEIPNSKDSRLVLNQVLVHCKSYLQNSLSKLLVALHTCLYKLVWVLKITYKITWYHSSLVIILFSFATSYTRLHQYALPSLSENHAKDKSVVITNITTKEIEKCLKHATFLTNMVTDWKTDQNLVSTDSRSIPYFLSTTCRKHWYLLSYSPLVLFLLYIVIFGLMFNDKY